MRECGECTLCCKLARVPELRKRTNTWCDHCAIGEGCRIYADRPQSCRTFRCWWLDHPEMPDELRPDRVHMYAVGQDDSSVLSVHVDPEFPEWDCSPLIDYLNDRHLAVLIANRVTFLASDSLSIPEKLMLEWTL